MPNALKYRMPNGIAGDITRQSQAKIETQVFNSAAAFPGYGLFGRITSNKFVPVGTGDVAADVYGLLVRPFPITGANASDPLGTAVPPTTGLADVMRSGYATVKNNAGTPAKNGVVYIRVAAAAAGKPIGGIEAAADSTNTIVATGARFTGAADADGLVEIEYNI